MRWGLEKAIHESCGEVLVFYHNTGAFKLHASTTGDRGQDKPLPLTDPISGVGVEKCFVKDKMLFYKLTKSNSEEFEKYFIYNPTSSYLSIAPGGLDGCPKRLITFTNENYGWFYWEFKKN